MPLESDEIRSETCAEAAHRGRAMGATGGDHTAAMWPTTTARDLWLLGLDKASEDNTGHMYDGCVVYNDP